MDNCVVRAESLCRSYKKILAINGVTLNVYQGEIFCLIGPDGAGKSSLLSILAGILRADSGSAEVLGVDVLTEPERIKPRIGFMAQGLGHSLAPDLSVEENIDYFAAIRGVARAQRDEMKARLLEVTRLSGFADRAAGNLSGGMKQKLALCCTLIHRPRLLLLDEPTTGVDPISRRDFYEVIGRMVSSEGISALISTSYMDEAERAHRVALMHSGRLLACGDPPSLKESFAGADRAEETDMESVFRRAIRTHGAGEEAEPDRRRIAGLLDRADFSADADGPPDSVVSAKSLTRRFGSFVAVENVSFGVNRGEIFGFLGPNGAGKTTLIKMLCGLLAPSGGSGQVLGVPLRAGKLKIAERIGYMSQKFSLYNDLRVIDNLKLFGGIYGLGGGRLSRRVGAALELADLVGRRREITRRLPLGIKQRLALACATLHRPSLVFLDEPTSGVDPLARDRFWLVIGELASRGVTAIVTTHYMEEAERCHRLLLMNEGAIATLGRPAELKQQVRAQIGEPIAVTCAALTDALQILKERFRHVTVFGAAVYAYSTQPTSDEQRIKLLLEERGVAEATVRRRQMPFEEVFVHFTRGAEGSDARVA